MREDVAKSTIFYGWVIAGACFAATLTLGEAMWTFGVFFKPLQREFGWSRAVVSSGYTAFLIGFGVSAVATGRLADRYSPRPILFISAILAGLGVSLCSQVQSINQLRIFLLVGGLGGGATWSVPATTVQRWFHGRPRAGLALGIVIAGVGIGGLIFAPLVNYLIISYGWRTAYVLVGLLFFVVMTASSLVIKQNPDKIGKASEMAENRRAYSFARSWTTRKIMATPSFFGITFVHSTVVFAFHIVAVHLVPHATDLGISPTASAMALGLFGGFSVPGRVMAGYMADRLGWQKILPASLFGLALFLVWLLFVRGPWMLYGFVLFYGISHGGRAASHLGILGQFFGMQSLGTLIGFTMAIGIFIGALAPYIAGSIFDVTGSYHFVFVILIGLQLSGGVIATVMKRPGKADEHMPFP